MLKQSRDISVFLELLLKDMKKLSEPPAPWVSISAVEGWKTILAKLIEAGQDDGK